MFIWDETFAALGWCVGVMGRGRDAIGGFHSRRRYDPGGLLWLPWDPGGLGASDFPAVQTFMVSLARAALTDRSGYNLQSLSFAISLAFVGSYRLLECSLRYDSQQPLHFANACPHAGQSSGRAT